MDRRYFLAAATAGGTALWSSASVSSVKADGQNADQTVPVTFALNTSTIRGHELTVPQQIDVTAKAGYDGIEPWIRDVRNFVDQGGKPADLRKQIEDAGLTVDSAIGFANWIVDDDAARQAGLDEARRDMELIKSIGGSRIAAPPIGVHRPKPNDPPAPSLPVIAERYGALLDVGAEVGVTPMLELWGFSPTLSTLAELAYVSTGAMSDNACVLPDFYHIYKGGNDFAGLAMIESSRMPVFHINDYPATPGVSDIADADRVFPGDGVCELPTIIRGMIDRGFTGVFSLELFNPEYWKRDALDVCTEGLQKSKAVVQEAIAP